MARGGGQTGAKPPTIDDILGFYRDKVVPALAAALAIDDKFPQEVLNEIRNSFTHLAAANAETKDQSKLAHELNAALRHLRRACIDCLKVCIYTLAKRCDKAIDALTYDLQLPDHVYKKMSTLRRRRKELSAAEGTRSLEDPLQEYESLANDYDEFYVSLDQEFAGDTASDRKRLRFRKRLLDWSLSFILGVIAGVAGNFIWSRF